MSTDPNKPAETPTSETPATPATPPVTDPAKPAETATDPNKPAEGEEGEGVVDPAKAPAAAKQLTAVQLEGKRFTDAFGLQGAGWYLEGKSFEEAQHLFAQQKDQELAHLRTENTQLKSSITALRGEKGPLTFSEPGGNPADDAKKFAADDNATKIAKSIKLPGRRK